MRARAIVASVIVSVCAACVSTQDLGAWSNADDAGDGGSTSTAASNPREGLELPVPNKACPANAPTPGSECHAASGECAYALRDIDQVGRPICGRSCTCSISGTWMCATAPCPYLDANTCGEGIACVGDVQCWADCTRAGGSCRRCTCRGGRMTCTDDTRPPS